MDDVVVAVLGVDELLRDDVASEEPPLAEESFEEPSEGLLPEESPLEADTAPLRESVR